jgi:hypothetical protein
MRKKPNKNENMVGFQANACQSCIDILHHLTFLRQRTPDMGFVVNFFKTFSICPERRSVVDKSTLAKARSRVLMAKNAEFCSICRMAILGLGFLFWLGFVCVLVLAMASINANEAAARGVVAAISVEPLDVIFVFFGVLFLD